MVIKIERSVGGKMCFVGFGLICAFRENGEKRYALRIRDGNIALILKIGAVAINDAMPL